MYEAPSGNQRRKRVASDIVFPLSLATPVEQVPRSRGGQDEYARHRRDSTTRLSSPGPYGGREIVQTDRSRQLGHLSETHSALRRLAKLIGQNASPAEVFAAVTKEIRQRFRSATARMVRFECDGTATVVANEGTAGPHVRVGEQWTDFPDAGLTRTVWRSGQPARVDDYRNLPGGEPYSAEGLVSAVAVPINVHGRLWGFIAIGSRTGPLAPDAEERLAEFTDLTAAAIATAQSRAELIASRARIVAACDEARERIERDLHDGAQQQLVTLSLKASTLALCPESSARVRADLEDLSRGLKTVIAELREIARGIHPAILSEAGLAPALRALASRSTLPVRVRAHVPARLPPPVEVGAYYVVSESLTNAAKHSRATGVHVEAELENGVLRVSVADDGTGGANSREGSGLAGLRDRVEALGGWLAIDSPPGMGTRIRCAIPAGEQGSR